MISINLFYVFLISLFSCIVLIPPISKLAVTMGMLDLPDERKVHAQDTPRLGGFAIFFAFLLALLLFGDFTPQTRGFLAGAVIIFLTGLADDLVGLTPKNKFLGEFTAALCAVIVGGISLSSVGNLFGQGDIALGPLAVPFTVLAIVGVTNAVNMLDGLDGLAGGVTAIAVGAICVLSFLSGNMPLMVMSIALLGALLGFLRYNTYPATIFMGDAGSLLLGYCLGFFSVLVVVQGRGLISEVTPLIILAVPVMDTLFVMFRRLKKGQSPFSPDRSHIHHRLMGFGFGHKRTVIIVYGYCYLLALFAVGLYRLDDRLQFALLAILVLLFCVGNRLLDEKRLPDAFGLFRSSPPIRQTRTYRKLVIISKNLRSVAKYLIIIIILLVSVFPPSGSGTNMPLIACVLFFLSLVLALRPHDLNNRFLLFVLYFDGAFLIYQMENFGRSVTLLGIPLTALTIGLFSLLLAIAGIKLFLRRSSGKFTTSPLEYLILFIVISVPLLPDQLTAPHHLLTVTGKSIILFVGYKLVLMHEARRNRKIIAATLAALFISAVKWLV